METQFCLQQMMKIRLILDKNGSGIPNEDNSKKCYVYISITNGSEKVQIQKNEETGEFYIEGDSLTADLDGQEFKINYSFYEVKDNGGTFITSTSKTFTVRDGYYYTDSDKKTSGYGLVTDWSSSVLLLVLKLLFLQFLGKLRLQTLQQVKQLKFIMIFKFLR